VRGLKQGFFLGAIALLACNTEELVLPNAPSAFAGFDGFATIGESVVLDGSLSHDPDGDVLSYSWRLHAAPAGSAARIHDSDARVTRLEPELLGTYVLSLSVSDGYLHGRDLVAITVTSSAAPSVRPELEMSPRTQNVAPSDARIELDATGDGDLEAFFMRVPAGAHAEELALELTDRKISFFGTRPGEYWIAALASNANAVSTPAIATVLVTADPASKPRASLAAPRTAKINDRVLFDGRGSDGDLTFELLADPSMGVDTLADVATGCPAGRCRLLLPSKTGTYVVQLSVTRDGVRGVSAVHAVEVELK
jgi:hypothetical protein